MSQVFANPEELERFAAALVAFLDDLQAAQGGLGGAFTALGDSWRDQNREQFEESFNAFQQHLAAFSEGAREQIPYLMAQAAALRAYLGH